MAPNNTPLPQLVKYTTTNTQTQTDSIQISAKAGGTIEKIVNVEIMAQYGHTWTNSYACSIERNQTIPPETEGAIFGTIPIYRVHGDFIITYLGATFTLTDVYFDTLIDGNGKTSFSFEQQPLPPNTEPAGAGLG